MYDFDRLFPRYEKYDPVVPIWIATPNTDRVMHRFHTSSPISPSGKYLALIRLPYEDRLPIPGDEAELVVIDLFTGETRTVATTRGWDSQTGAHVQWGASDDDLFYNDMDTSSWEPFGVKLHMVTGEKTTIEGCVYSVSPDGHLAASTCLRRIGMTQPGYGVRVPVEYQPANKGAAKDDGVFISDTSTGQMKLMISYREIVETLNIDMSSYGRGDFYGFHVQWNPQSTRLLLVLRYRLRRTLLRRRTPYKPQLITMKPDGSDMHITIPPEEWAEKGGNHPAWQPDGERILMNLNIDHDGWRLVEAAYNGSGYRPISDRIIGRGHPTYHRNKRQVLTDAYPFDRVFADDQTAPLWLYDVQEDQLISAARVPCSPAFMGPRRQMRVDLHPAWDPSHRYAVFNAVLGSTRRVCIADLQPLLR